MAASQIWQVPAPEGAGAGAFRASKTMYTTIGAEAGISALPAAAGKTIPVYSIGELVRVGWLIPINVILQASTSGRTKGVTVYCSSEMASAFAAKCRTEPSGLTIGGKLVLSANFRTKQSFV